MKDNKKMNCTLFWIGQIGIFLEVIGAGYIVFAAYKSHTNLKNKSHSIDAADLMESTLIEVRGQYKKELKGFSILLIGLAMQFIGNFSI